MKKWKNKKLIKLIFLNLKSSNKKKKFSIMADRKAVIKNADMAEDMQSDAVDCAN